MPSLSRVIGEITLRRAESPADYFACQQAQRLAWGITEDGYVIPVATMVGANLHGGLVLGAFLPDGEAIAMSFAFLGRVENRLCLYSQLTGVVPGHQSLGLGFELKHLQRAFAQSENIPVIAWAFDPLQAGNARFNLAKLGARVRRYVDNMYGPRTDALNAGVPTDRVIAEWEVADAPHPSPSSPPWVEPTTLPALIEATPGASGMLEPRASRRTGGEPLVRLEIPPDAATLRRERPELAEAWRKTVREAFLGALDEGYEAVNFVRYEVEGAARCAYLLEKPPL